MNRYYLGDHAVLQRGGNPSGNSRQSARDQLDKQIVAVDDHSSDNTFAILEREAARDPNLVVVRHPMNRGKGAAVRSDWRAPPAKS